MLRLFQASACARRPATQRVSVESADSEINMGNVHQDEQSSRRRGSTSEQLSVRSRQGGSSKLWQRASARVTWAMSLSRRRHTSERRSSQSSTGAPEQRPRGAARVSSEYRSTFGCGIRLSVRSPRTCAGSFVLEDVFVATAASQDGLGTPYDEPSGPPGKLILNLHSARNLRAADSNGYSDPYVSVDCIGNWRWRSRVRWMTRNPTWCQERAFDGFLIDLTRAPLRLRVYDLDLWKPDDLLGTLDVSLQGLEYGRTLHFTDVPLQVCHVLVLR